MPRVPATDDEMATAPAERVSGIPIRRIRVSVTSHDEPQRVLESDGEVVTVGSATSNDVIVSDAFVSRFHMELRRRGSKLWVKDLDSTNGIRLGAVSLSDGNAVLVELPFTVQLGSTTLFVSDGAAATVPRGPRRFHGLVAESTSMRELVATIQRVSSKDVPVLITGESGTGKELVAHALHRESSRRDEPFVVVDCASLSPGVLGSELFGHERGAFTGAERRHQGAFERAGHGTLLLDEIGELPAEQQAALLGALERRTIRRVGGRDDIPVSARIVAATHRDLRRAVNHNTFRLDLFYRIAVVQLHLPPLRDHPEDIPAIISAILEDVGAPQDATALFPTEVLNELRRRSWPGNVRELRNEVLRAVALDEPPTGEMSPRSDRSVEHEGAVPPYRVARAEVVERFEREYLTLLLQRSAGNVRQAARLAKMDRTYLIELMTKHGLR